MKLDKLIKDAEVIAVTGRTDVEIAGIVADSRQARAGCLFVAAVGHALDGRAFVDDAVARGAVAIASEQEARGRRDVTWLQVRNARLATGELAAAFHRRPADRLRMVGITGTNGKTTTAFLTRDLLRAGEIESGLISTVEYRFGSRATPASRTTPEATLLHSLLAQMEAAGCRSAVMEVSSHALDQDRAAGLDFDVGVFTNVTRDHLDYHRTVENYFEAKRRLFTGLGKGRKKAVAILNADCPWGRKLAAMPDLSAEVITYGLRESAAVRAEQLELTSQGSRFTTRTPWGTARVQTALLGRYNVSNALAALASAAWLGVDFEAAVRSLAATTTVPGRLEEVPTRRGFQVFVDYAHTDDALENVLTTLRELRKGRLIVVFGCGGNRDVTKRPAMGRVASRLADVSIVTSDNPRREDPAAIVAQIMEGFDRRAAHKEIVERGEAIRTALRLAQKDDIVLIAGKGHETFQEFANTTVPFDDRDVVRKALNGGRQAPGEGDQ